MFELRKLCQTFYFTNLAKLGCSFLEHKKKHAGSEIYLKKIGGRLEKITFRGGRSREIFWRLLNFPPVHPCVYCV